MESKTKEALTYWITGAAPESAHPSDMKRFYDAIFACLASGDRVDYEELSKIIKENLKWNEEKVEEFAIEKAILADHILGFVEYLKSQKRINVYNQI